MRVKPTALVGATGRPPVRALAVLGAVLAASGCATPAPDVVSVEVRVPSGVCRPTGVRAVRLSLLGDFAPSPTDTVELLASAGARDLAGLRAEMRTLVVEVEGDGGYLAWGRGSLEAVRASGVLAALPLYRSCSIADPDAYRPDGAALVTHPSGSVWIVGGVGAERRIVQVDPRRAFADVLPDALFNPRVGATATLVGDDVVVAGGAAGPAERAFDTYERLGGDARPAGDGPGGRLSVPRRDHGAVRLGELLVLVGGRSGGADDALVDRIDLIDLGAGAPRLGPALAVPRTAPTALALADGSIVVLGGRDASGAPVAVIERIEPGLTRVRTLDVSLPAPEVVLGLGLDRAFHVADREVRVLSFRSDPPRLERLTHQSALSSTVGVASANDRVLLVGRNASGSVSAELWTPHLGTMQTLEASRVVSALAPLPDGSVLEIGADGASLRMLEVPDQWANLPNDRLFFPTDLGDPVVTAGLPGDLDRGVAMRTGAAIGLGALRFGSLTLSPELDGAASIRLVADGDVTAIEVDASGNVSGPGCELPPSGDDPIVIVRARERLELTRGPLRSRCEDVEPSAQLGVEVRLDRGSVLRSLRASRRID
ncbi:MAG: hypothetical protein OHK0013_30420 [Sandaracinaceae bacterium]